MGNFLCICVTFFKLKTIVNRKCALRKTSEVETIENVNNIQEKGKMQ